MRLRHLSALALVASCQSRAASGPKDEPIDPPIEVRAPSGTVTARVHRGFPCRASVEGLDMQVGVSPLVAMVGATQWTSQHDPRAGTLLLRDGKLAARIFVPTTTSVELFDAEGLALLKTTGTSDVLLQTVLAAANVTPEVRAMTACHLINQPTQKAAP